MWSSKIVLAAQAVVEAYENAGLTIATAESCTGGLIAGALTEISGSSAVVDRGYVTYSNEAKIECLGVSAALIEAHGAVSEHVAAAMAKGALDIAGVSAAIAVTGVAGPTGGSADKPVGTVWFGLAHSDKVHAERYIFKGLSRTEVRLATVQQALKMLLTVEL